MTIIDRAVVKAFFSSYFILLFTGIGLYVFSDVIVNLDEFTEDPNLNFAGVMMQIIDFHGHKMPLYFHQLGGVMLAMAAAFTFAVMLKNNELTPLIAAGIPLQRLAVPVLGSSVVLVVLWLLNSELLVPENAAQIARSHSDMTWSQQSQVLYVRDENGAILSAAEMNARSGWLKAVQIIEPDADGNLSHVISADEARYDPERKTWHLGRGARLIMGDAFAREGLGRSIRREPVNEYPFSLSPEQILLRQSSQWADLMSIRQMNGLLQSRNLPNLTAVAKARDIRFSQPLLIWILILLAVPFFLTREPTNVLVAGGKALLFCGLCFGFTFVAHSMPYQQLAIAMPVLIFGPAAVLHLANVKT